MIELIDYRDKSFEEKIKTILNRSNTFDEEKEKIVKDIVNDVRLNGDSAVIKYSKKFDSLDLNVENFKLDYDFIKNSADRIDKKLLDSLKFAHERIEKFHKSQIRQSHFTIDNGEILAQMIRPISSAMLYVPGGKASYPSSVLMNVVPAKVAGVKRIVISTAPSKDGINDAVLAAAYISGVNDIYQIGGAQAIAAFAYGTKSIEKVEKITGPGNIYVALAKKEVFGQVSIDSIAGPSEILIIADDSANPKFVAADLLAQAEHDEMASSILLTTDKDFAKKVKFEINNYLKNIKRKDIIEKSLKNHGAIISFDNINDIIAISNKIAPEHLEISTKDNLDILSKITNAGAIFIGNYTAEVLGDYIAGTNHVLPTGSTAGFFSPLSVDDFINKTSILSFSKNKFQEIGAHASKIAESEGLYAHKESIDVRLGDINEKS